MAFADPISQGADSRRLDGIDLLRGLAIFFVLMNHINIRLLGAKVLYTRFLPAQLTHFLVWNGQLGVQIFFAVSGFLITSITIRRWGPLAQVNLRGFYLFRFARIAPLLFLLLAVLCGLHFASIHNYVVSAKTGGIGRALLAALTFHVNELEIHRGYLPGNWDILWSLSVEEMFYLFFPLVCLLCGDNRRAGLGKALIAVLAVFVVLGPFSRTVFARGSEIAQEYSYLGGMEGIALGCLTALIVAHKRFSRRTLRGLGIGGALIVAKLSRLAGQHGTEFHGPGHRNMHVHCRHYTDAVEKSSRDRAAVADRQVQLRNLSDPHVCCFHLVRLVSQRRQADAPGAGLVRFHHTDRRILRRRGRKPLFRAHESLLAPQIRGRGHSQSKPSD